MSIYSDSLGCRWSSVLIHQCFAILMLFSRRLAYLPSSTHPPMNVKPVPEKSENMQTMCSFSLNMVNLQHNQIRSSCQKFLSHPSVLDLQNQDFETGVTIMIHRYIPCLQLTEKAPENWWLGRCNSFPYLLWGPSFFLVVRTVFQLQGNNPCTYCKKTCYRKRMAGTTQKLVVWVDVSPLSHFPFRGIFRFQLFVFEALYLFQHRLSLCNSVAQERLTFGEVSQMETMKKPSYFPLYWLVNRDPYNGLS